jgi:hypothetical protein
MYAYIMEYLLVEGSRRINHHFLSYLIDGTVYCSLLHSISNLLAKHSC